VLDPGGEKWRARNRVHYETGVSNAQNIDAPNERAAAIATAQAELDKFDAAFNSGHYPDYTRKLYLIERCLHGVDIQPIAVQIAKLRCFISLAVEQKADDSRPNRGITPLPNLETKLVAANTLTPLHRKGQMELQDKQIDITLASLRLEFGSLFTAANGAAKRKIQKRIDELIEKLVQLLKDDRALSSDEVKLVAQWRPFDQNSSAPFFDPELMFGLKPSANEGWFDIALANPPYVRQEKIESFRINGKPVVSKAQLKADYKTYAGTADLLVYFYERALRLLKPEGALAFITSNKWYILNYGKGLREWCAGRAS
jgi:adenine-specific DNA-methyltransferase